MAVIRNWEYHSLASFDGPDDYRPDSELAIVVDPGRAPRATTRLLRWPSTSENFSREIPRRPCVC